MSTTITISFSITITSGDGTLPGIHIEAPVATVAAATDEPTSLEEEQEIAEMEFETDQLVVDGIPGKIDSEPPTVEVEQGKPSGRFLWTQEMIEVLERDFLAGSQVTPKRAVRTILNDIAEKHGWTPSAVGYKFYQLKSSKQQGWTEVPAEQSPANVQSEQPPAAQPLNKAKKKIELPNALTEPEEGMLPTLAPGDVSWEVRIDGMPLKIHLAYPYGSFPYQTNTRIHYRDRTYRVGRSWNNAVDLTSEDADVYETQ